MFSSHRSTAGVEQGRLLGEVFVGERCFAAVIEVHAKPLESPGDIRRVWVLIKRKTKDAVRLKLARGDVGKKEDRIPVPARTLPRRFQPGPDHDLQGVGNIQRDLERPSLFHSAGGSLSLPDPVACPQSKSIPP